MWIPYSKLLLFSILAAAPPSAEDPLKLSVCIAKIYWPDRRGSIPGSVQTGYGPHATFYAVGNGGFFLDGKAGGV
jgi:hypothetical protein